jgi:hypothetical protein
VLLQGYRGSVLAELFRALAALKLLQAEAREFPDSAPPDAARAILPPPGAATKRTREVVATQSFSFQAGDDRVPARRVPSTGSQSFFYRVRSEQR